MIEEIKKILQKYAQWVLDVRSRINEPDFNKALDAYCDLEDAAQKICKLFEEEKEEILKLLTDYSKGAHLDDKGFYWHFEIPNKKLKEIFPNVNW